MYNFMVSKLVSKCKTSLYHSPNS